MRDELRIEPIGLTKNQLEELEPLKQSIVQLRKDVDINTRKLEEKIDIINGEAVKDLLQQVVDRLDSNDISSLRASIDDFNQTIKSINKATDTDYQELPQVVQIDLSNQSAQSLRLFLRQFKLALEAEPLSTQTASDFHKHVQTPAFKADQSVSMTPGSSRIYTTPKSNIDRADQPPSDKSYFTEVKETVKDSELWKQTVGEGKKLALTPFAEITTLSKPFVDLAKKLGDIQIKGRSESKEKTAQINEVSTRSAFPVVTSPAQAAPNSIDSNNAKNIEQIKEILLHRIAPDIATLAGNSTKTLRQQASAKAAADADAYDVGASEPIETQSVPESEEVQYVEAQSSTSTRESFLSGMHIGDLGKKLLLGAAIVGGLTLYFSSPKFKEWVDGFLEKLGKVVKDALWKLAEAVGWLKAPVSITESKGNTFSTEAAARRNAGNRFFDDINQYPEWLQRMIAGFTVNDIVDASTGEQVTLDTDLKKLFANEKARAYYADDPFYSLRANEGKPGAFTVRGSRGRDANISRTELEKQAIKNLRSLQRSMPPEARQAKLDAWANMTTEQRLDFIDERFPLSANLRKQLAQQDLSDFESVLRLLSMSVESMVYQRDERGKKVWDFAYHNWNRVFVDQRREIMEATPGAIQFNFKTGLSSKRDQLRDYAYKFTNAGLMSFDDPTNPFNTFNNAERDHIDKVIQGMRAGIEPSENDMQVFNILLNRANVNIGQGSSASAMLAAQRVNEYATISYVPRKQGQTRDPHGNPIITKDAYTSGSRTPGVNQGWCANHVWHALHEAGATEVQAQPNAAAFVKHLPEVGWIEVEGSEYKIGDVAVNEGNSAHPDGHIALWDGTQWVSDFIQRDIDVFHGTGGKIHVFRRPQWSLPQIQIPKFAYRTESVEGIPAQTQMTPGQAVKVNASETQLVTPNQTAPGSDGAPTAQTLESPREIQQRVIGTPTEVRPEQVNNDNYVANNANVTNVVNEGSTSTITVLDTQSPRLEFNNV